jgi:hypothetical protein
MRQDNGPGSIARAVEPKLRIAIHLHSSIRDLTFKKFLRVYRWQACLRRQRESVI